MTRLRWLLIALVTGALAVSAVILMRAALVSVSDVSVRAARGRQVLKREAPAPAPREEPTPIAPPASPPPEPEAPPAETEEPPREIATPSVDAGEDGQVSLTSAEVQPAEAGAPDAGAEPAASAAEIEAGPPPPPPPRELGPSFSAGAGRFLSEPPIGYASSYTPPINAGAGSFTTTPIDPWNTASSYTPPENAGAGGFTTERNYDYAFLFATPMFVFTPIGQPAVPAGQVAAPTPAPVVPAPAPVPMP